MGGGETGHGLADLPAGRRHPGKLVRSRLRAGKLEPLLVKLVGPASLLSAHEIHCFVMCHGQNPCRCPSSCRIKYRGFSPHRQKGVLHHIGREITVAHNPYSQRVRRLAVPVVHLCECLPVTLAHTLQQFAIRGLFAVSSFVTLVVWHSSLGRDRFNAPGPGSAEAQPAGT